jgi:3-methyladenine DNA glycosylase AlkC
LDRTPEEVLSAAVAAIAERRAVIEQAKGMLILLYGVDEEAAFDMLRARSQHANIKLRALAERLVFDYRALSNGEVLKPRSVYEKTLTTVHQRITRDRSDSSASSLMH